MPLDLEQLRAILDDGPTPLFATVSGAHLYGFESPDSDVDLRGAFVLPLGRRLALVPPDETIAVSRTDGGLELDWVAHDVRKFASMMTRRNGYVLEQLYSPIVVHGGERLDELRQIGRGCVVRHLVHHYRGFAHTKRRELERPGATVKDLLYAYRVYLTGIRVLETGEILTHLPTLLDAHRADGVEELLERKRAGAEKAALAAGEAEAHRPRLDALEAALGDAFDRSTLPERPTTMDALSEFVVRACLELGG